MNIITLIFFFLGIVSILLCCCQILIELILNFHTVYDSKVLTESIIGLNQK